MQLVLSKLPGESVAKVTVPVGVAAPIPSSVIVAVQVVCSPTASVLGRQPTAVPA